MSGPWRRLYEQVPSATPFSSPEWVLSWLTHYTPPEDAVVVTVWEGENLLALAPLYRRRARGVRVLALAGEGVSDYLDVLVRPDAGARVWEPLVAGLQSVGDWDALDLRQLADGAAAAELWSRWPGPVLRRGDDPCSRLDLRAVEELGDLVAARSKATRKKVQQKERRAQREDVSHRVVDPVLPADVGTLIAIHRRRWDAQTITPEHRTERYAAHLAQAVPALAAAGEAVLYEVVSPKGVLASRLLFARGPWLGDYLYGIEPAAMVVAGLDMNVVLMSSAVDVGRGRGAETFDFLRGLEPHKAMWQPAPTPTTRLTLGRRGVRWAGYRAAVTARTMLARRARTMAAARAARDVIRGLGRRSGA